MSKKRKIFRKSEENGYVIVENMIVMPVVFLVLFALIFSGCMLHARCTIESAARRGVIYATKLVCDPQYEKITENAVDGSKGDLSELAAAEFDFTKIEHYQPYRYVPFLAGSSLSKVEESTGKYVKAVIDQNATWMFTINADSIECEAKNYMINQKITVKITATYYVPKILTYLGVPETYDLKAESVISASDQDEFIRNIDFVQDLLLEINDRTGWLDKIKSQIGKMKSFMGKIFG